MAEKEIQVDVRELMAQHIDSPIPAGFRPLLAAICDDDNFDQLKYPLYVSPKLDGIRVCVLNGKLVSRTLKPIRNKHLQAAYDWPDVDGIDGEIIIGNPKDKDAFRRTTSAVMSDSGNIDDWWFHIFDDFRLGLKASLGFEERYNALLKVGFHKPFCIVPHKKIYTAQELLTYEQMVLETGFEGAMIRSVDGRYKLGRSTFNEGHLIKLKRGQVRNGDAEITGFEERMQNTNAATIDNLGLQKRSSHKEGMVGKGDLGAFRVKDIDSGHEFKIGTGDGLNDALRKQVWDNQAAYLGKVVRYEWFAYGGYDLPRFPQFVAFRDKEDITTDYVGDQDE